MSANVSRKETERTKLIQEKCQTLLTQMLRDEDNKYCVDCDAKGPRWASWNLGVFLCIRCAGIHRNLGVHISRVKSVNLDTWTPEQVISLQQMGNSRARAVYEAQLPDGFRRPQTDNALESFIRAKYEHKKYLAREWVPPSPPKVDWAKEIDEELEKQKRKKKAAQACSALGIGVMSSGGGGIEKKSSTGSSAARSAPLPAPLPKPKPGQSGSSPKTQRLNTSSNAANVEQQTNDLLGLQSPTKPIQSSVGAAAQDLQNDSFSGFLSAPVINAVAGDNKTDHHASPQNSAASNNTLAKEEEDFFNQGSLGAASAGGEKDKSGKLTKDSILALYATAPSNPLATATHAHSQPMNFGQQSGQQLFQQNQFGINTGHNMAFTGMSPGFMGAAAGAPQQQQQQQHQQFMTPPNSASMYNAPVMTAPNAFSTPGMGGLQMGGNATVAGVVGGFGAQFPGMTHAAYPAQLPAGMMQPQSMMMGGGIMATGQNATTGNNLNLMQTNQSLLSGMQIGMSGGSVAMQQHTMPQMAGVGMHGIGGLGGMPNMGGLSAMSAFQTPMAGSAATAASNANLNQQFGNLNIGNVWQ